MAGLALKMMSERKMDVGTVPEDFLRSIPGMEDAPEPAVLLARIFAHLGHRIPGLRRIEKRLEGTERTAGFGSDLLALSIQLYFRNRDLIRAGVHAAREARANQTKEQTTTTGGFPS